MTQSEQLRQAIRRGIHRIGQIEIQRNLDGYYYVLCHEKDAELVQEPALGGLDHYQNPQAARDISTYSEDGEYRFTKGMTNLRQGWVLTLETEEELRQALDLFYPACLGLWLASENGHLETQYLRDKLNRQTGMYQFAKNISDAGAQLLVQKICGPAHQCAKKILWQIDANTPLEPSEASQFNGIPSSLPESEAIPLLCREACNHFVAECRKVSRAEFQQRQASSTL